jgi:hypothetical protein
MTTEEWIEVALRRCRSALQEPDMQHFETLLDQAGSSASARLEALESTAVALQLNRGF